MLALVERLAALSDLPEIQTKRSHVLGKARVQNFVPRPPHLSFRRRRTYPTRNIYHLNSFLIVATRSFIFVKGSINQPPSKRRGVRLHEMPVTDGPITPKTKTSDLQSKINGYNIQVKENRRAISREVLLHVSGE